jgi:hypothetical protein
MASWELSPQQRSMTLERRKMKRVVCWSRTCGLRRAVELERCGPWHRSCCSNTKMLFSDIRYRLPRIAPQAGTDQW